MDFEFRRDIFLFRLKLFIDLAVYTLYTLLLLLLSLIFDENTEEFVDNIGRKVFMYLIFISLTI